MVELIIGLVFLAMCFMPTVTGGGPGFRNHF